MQSAANSIRDWARELGFSDCRIASARLASHSKEFLAWLAEGRHADMEWMARTPERRCDPRCVLDGCESIICLALNYFPGTSPFQKNHLGGYRIARYAWNRDYHDWIAKQLKEFDHRLRSLGGVQRPYVDTGPVLERDFASDSGLGWNGKSTVQIHPRLGTWFFLAEILTTLPLPPDPPSSNRCGSCTRCIQVCPTQAIIRPHELDARRCISYLTIEHHGPIPIEFRRAIGDRIYGCDECLEVCPWNRFAQISREATFLARPEVFSLRLRDFLDLTDESFRSLFAKSPIKRIKLPRFLRNVCVALGNTGSQEDLPALVAASAHSDPLVAEHASWAILNVASRMATISV